MENKLIVAIFTLIGSIIGAGILGLPYVFSRTGFFLSSLYLLILFLIMLFVYLSVGELVCRIKGNHQLVGCANKLFGKSGRNIMFLSMFISANSALLAYLIGEGESFSTLFFGNKNFTILFSVLFWGVMSFFLLGGIKQLKKIETYGVCFIILMITIVLIIYLPKVQFSNLVYINSNNSHSLFLPIGVILFSLLGFTSVPELKFELGKSKHLLKKVIIIGLSIPVIIYFLFTFSVVGAFGENIEQVVTLTSGMGILVNLLGIFTMFPCYFVLSFSILDMYFYDLKFSKRKSYLITIITPLLIYILSNFFGLANFIIVISMGGVISGGIIGILSIWMNYKSKKIGKEIPPYSIPMNKIIAIIISAIFVLAMILQLFF